MTHERFNLDFYLTYFPYEKKELPTDPKPLEKWFQGQNLTEIEILYIVGLPGYPLPQSVLTWLKERQERALVFIEEDLGAIASFDNFKLLDNPQIHLHFAQEDPIETLAQMFPCDRLAIFEGKPFNSLALQRRSAALSALYSDVLYSHKIVENVLANYLRLPDCFDANTLKFQSVPAIICGAGPSLEKSFDALRTARDKALIFAGGSAIPILSRNKIRPHFAIALDPNNEEFDRLKQCTDTEVPFLFAPRVHHEVLATRTGLLGYLKTDTGGLFENWLEEKLGLDAIPTGPDMGPEAFSVTTLAISYAYALGCNPIILTGVDLAYTAGKRYAPGVEAEKGNSTDPRALEKVLIRIDLQGKPVETLLKWVMEADCISAFAKSHPETRFINATEGGLGFEGIQNTTLAEEVKGMKTANLDFPKKAIPIDPNQLTSLIAQLEESLGRCAILCDRILKNDPRTPLFEMDLAEEEGYVALLEGISAALDRLLVRYHPHSEEQRKIAKYQELLLQIEKFKRIINQQCGISYR
ncbi:MAG: motility associated factor glycosyltransferase family protein [Verrucomicrobia bacterium]|nr:motility associated factor glycosyltransferase family protein [Verrucomicrobiota bacterium]